LTLVGVVAWNLEPVRTFAAGLIGQGPVYFLTFFAQLWALFALGMAAHVFRDRLVLSWWILAAIAIANYLLQDFTLGRHVRDLFIGYAVLCCGLLTARRGPMSARWPDYSYGIYIFAFPIMMLIASVWRPHSPWLLAAANLAATVPVAAISWHFIEKPALDAIKSRRSRTAPAT
jgi:peptidoglycan/LPS O-acetylase OafA/YrhL